MNPTSIRRLIRLTIACAICLSHGIAHAGLEGNPADAPSPGTFGWNGVNHTSDLRNFENTHVSPDGDQALLFEWSGSGEGDECRPFLDGNPAGSLPLKNPAPNDLSDLHFIAAGKEPDPGVRL